MMRHNLFNRIILLLLVVSIMLLTSGCTNAPSSPTISDAIPQIGTWISLMQGI